ncbi:gliding motility-associated C-terminal domain-containing protein [Flavobacterium sp. J372]|uniref:T9SS type B sorting domain-containing protein n=1 Tax=Flavobacterium sp. J372 TaxID=2898436 RepID=UPI0021510434|nr:gliding motility-associated C-terminal domain-containing protein [Flavobacterium sp. J372]MCR5861100.1 gliding motility-associated C-terminal domain-containing protein [Flavobacterium sp. J372]
MSGKLWCSHKGGGIPQGTGITTDNNTAYLADGLQEATPYEYWIRNNCNNGTFSAWAGPYLFSTTQVPAILNYSQDFETLPSGFSFISGTQPNKWVVGNATSNGGTNALYISNDNGVTNAYTETTTSIVHAYRDIQIPAVLGASNEISVAFDLKGIGDANDYLRVWLVPTNYTIPATGITALANQRIKLGPDYFNNTAWTNIEYTQNVQPFAGQIMRLVFEWRNNATVGNQPPAAIDNLNVRLILCAKPSNLQATNPTINSVNLTWNAPANGGAESYDYYYSTSPVPPTDATPENGNTANLFANPTDLVDASTYYVWVRSVCSGTNGKSLWFGPVMFMTPQIPATLNYSEGFEGTTSSFSFVNGNFVNKWAVGSATANGGTKSLYISNNNGTDNAYTTTTTTTTVFAYRDFTIPATLPHNEIDVSFDWKGAGESTFDYLRVWIVPVTFNPTAGTQITASAAQGRVQIGGNFNQNTNWTTVLNTLNVQQYLGTTRRIVFEWRNDATDGAQPPAAVDNINIKIVTCKKPTNLAAPLATITQTTAQLSWVDPNGATEWDIFISPVIGGTAPTEATPGIDVTGGLPTYPADGLTAGTQYNFWVRAVCGGTNGISQWAGPFQFSTKIANDECDQAITLTVNPDSLCGVTTLGTINGATASPQPNSCTGTADDDDAWFQFTATHDEHYIALLDTNGPNGTRLSTDDLIFAVYSGDCTTGLTQVSCSPDNNRIIPNLIPGQTYKVRIYSAGTTPRNWSFRICVGVVFNCEDNSSTFCAGPDSPPFQFLGSVGVPNLGTRNCLSTTPNPTFFTVKVLTPGPLQFTVSQTLIGGGGIDVDFIAYGPFTGPTAGCAAGLIPANVKDCSYSTAAVEQIDIPNALPGQWYTIMVTNFNGGRSTVNFTQNTNPGFAQSDCNAICTVDLGPDEILCGIPSKVLTATVIDADGYKWFLGTEEIIGATSSTYTATQTGIYKVIVDKPECLSVITDEISLTFGPAVNLPTQITASVCGAGGTASVLLPTFNNTVLGSLDPSQYVVEYYLTQAAANAGTAPLDPAIAVTLTGQSLFVRVESAIAATCFDTSELVVNIVTAPAATISYTGSPYCSNEATGTVTQTGNVGGVYSSTTGLSINASTGAIDIAASTPGTYTVTYTIAQTATCDEFTTTTQVTIVEAPTATISYPTPLCSNGTTAQVTQTGTTGGTYTSTAGLVIDPATGEINIAASTIGTYDVTYTIAATADCAAFSTQAQVVITAAATATINYPSSPFCSNETTGTVTQTGDTGGVYSSTTGLSIDAATGAVDIAASTPGTYTVTYTIAQTATCDEFTTTAQVTIVEAPSGTISYTTPLCSNGTTAQVTQTATAGGTYTSTAGLIIDPATGEINIAASTPGTYDITYTIAATADCAAFSTQAQIVITQIATATIDYGTGPFCSNGGVISVTQTGTTGGSYTSSTGLSINGTTGDIDLGASTAGTYTVTYTIAATGGCDPVTATASVTVTALPVAAFTYSPAIVCQNVANVAVTLGGGSTAGTFTSGPGLTIDPVTGAITPGTSTPGTYIVTNTIAAANGCPAVSDTFTVTINAAPVATFNYTASPYCKDDGTASPTLNGVAGTFSSTAGLVINASTGQVDLAMSEPGTYTVTNTIAASTECPSFFETATITVIANPDVFVEQGCDGNNYVLEVNFDNDDVYTEDTVTFSWIDPSGNTLTQTGREVIVTATGTYNVIVTPNAAGACAVTVPVQVDNTTCMVQRGISPNNDGKNDTFNLSALDVTKISIFNRYGQEVFSYGAYTDQWHGQGKGGDELPTGTYFYSFERANGEKATGWVYINREEN